MSLLNELHGRKNALDALLRVINSVAGLLESGSTVGCDGVIVMDLKQYLWAQQEMENFTGIAYGEIVIMEEEDEDGDTE